MSSAGSPPLIEIRDLQKAFGGTRVLRGVDFEIRKGEVSFIIGPSGGGKSTLLRCMNFLEVPDGGMIRFAGETLCEDKVEGFRLSSEPTLRAARARMPMVFQHFNLFNHKTVVENIVEGPVIVRAKPKAEAIELAYRLLGQFGLSDHVDKYPAQLSGGQKQRVAIVRALAMEPDAILFDEPTSALDPQLVGSVLEAMRALAGLGLTLVIVSHEMSFARALAHRVHFVFDGKIEESGSPEELFQMPKSDALKAFINSIQH